MYEPQEIPDMPSNDEIAAAISTLCDVAMNTAGDITGDIVRLPEQGTVDIRAFTFHFNFHDARLCGDAHDHQRSSDDIIIASSDADKSKLN